MSTTLDLTDRLTRFLRDYYREELGQFARHYPTDQRSLFVDWRDLYQFDVNLADDLLWNPDGIGQHLDEALRLYDLPINKDLSGATVRVYNLLRTHDVDGVRRHDNIGRLLDLYGQVTKVSDVKPRAEEAAFACQRCWTTTRVAQASTDLPTPHECGDVNGRGRSGSSPRRRPGSTTSMPASSNLRSGAGRHRPGDRRSPPGRPHRAFDAGDRVTLTGVLAVEEPDQTQTTTFDTYLDAEAVVREESDYEDVDVEAHRETIEAIANGERDDPYELLVDPINPKHHGDRDLKLAVALQLFGGWAHEYPDGSRDRGNWHVLLLGDPGCGKSTFLQHVDEIAPRSTYASGKGASAAGMTAAAVADDFGDTEWGLEAGAQVMADGGVACVDEIDKM